MNFLSIIARVLVSEWQIHTHSSGWVVVDWEVWRCFETVPFQHGRAALPQKGLLNFVLKRLALLQPRTHDASMQKIKIFLIGFWALAAAQSFACETALVLTIDVSNSIDVGEYRLQTDGMAAALRDPEIVDTMVQTQTAIAVVQWSGVDKQELSIPWVRITSALDAEILSQQAQNMERAFVLSDTAPAEAILFSMTLFDQVKDCTRKVIDVSGDGTPNSGTSVQSASRAAERAGITINGIAIESMGLAITNFYRNSVITRNGFVITARTHREYPTAIRAKILREISRILG